MIGRLAPQAETLTVVCAGGLRNPLLAVATPCTTYAPGRASVWKVLPKGNGVLMPEPVTVGLPVALEVRLGCEPAGAETMLQATCGTVSAENGAGQALSASAAVAVRLIAVLALPGAGEGVRASEGRLAPQAVLITGRNEGARTGPSASGAVRATCPAPLGTAAMKG